MSHWNLRVVFHDNDTYPFYGVHEVFYNDDNSIYGYTEDPISIRGENVDEIIKYLEMVLKDIKKNVILIESEVEFIDKEEGLVYDNQN